MSEGPPFERRKGDVFPWDEMRELRYTTHNLATEVEALTGTFTRLMTRQEIEDTLSRRIHKLEERVAKVASVKAEQVAEETNRKRRLATYWLIALVLATVNFAELHFQNCLLEAPSTTFGELACGAFTPAVQTLAPAAFSGRALGIAIYTLIAISIVVIEVAIRRPLPEQLDPTLLHRGEDDAI